MDSLIALPASFLPDVLNLRVVWALVFCIEGLFLVVNVYITGIGRCTSCFLPWPMFKCHLIAVAYTLDAFSLLVAVIPCLPWSSLVATFAHALVIKTRDLDLHGG